MSGRGSCDDRPLHGRLVGDACHERPAGQGDGLARNGSQREPGARRQRERALGQGGAHGVAQGRLAGIVERGGWLPVRVWEHEEGTLRAPTNVRDPLGQMHRRPSADSMEVAFPGGAKPVRGLENSAMPPLTFVKCTNPANTTSFFPEASVRSTLRTRSGGSCGRQRLRTPRHPSISLRAGFADKALTRRTKRGPKWGLVAAGMPCLSHGRYWARTSDPQLVELVLSQRS